MPIKSPTFAAQIVNHFTGRAISTPAPRVYFALFTAFTGPTGTITEVSGTGYTRAERINDATTWGAASTDGSASNGIAINFGTAGGSWGTITHFGIYDAAGGGNLLWFGPLSAAVTPGTGEAVIFPAGALVILEQ